MTDGASPLAGRCWKAQSTPLCATARTRASSSPRQGNEFNGGLVISSYRAVDVALAFRSRLRALALALLLSAGASAMLAAGAPGLAEAHQNGCHRWHSC